jgi:hypothetical protein
VRSSFMMPFVSLATAPVRRRRTDMSGIDIGMNLEMQPQAYARNLR